jgi:hypothetical protein
VRRGGAPWYVVALETHHDRVAGIRLVINPDKLLGIPSVMAP